MGPVEGPRSFTVLVLWVIGSEMFLITILENYFLLKLKNSIYLTENYLDLWFVHPSSFKQQGYLWVDLVLRSAFTSWALYLESIYPGLLKEPLIG